MKKHFFRIFLAVLCIVAGIMLSHLKLEDVYDLSIERTTISDVNLEYDRGVYRASTLTPKNIWYIGLKKEIFPDTSHDQIELCAVWYTHSGALRECVDHDGKDASGEYYTFPVGTDLSKYIAFSLESSTPIRPEDITLYSINTLSQGKRIAWDIVGTRAENGVISRAQWGADESLRYWDSAKQKAKYQAFLAYAARPKTQKELDTIKRNQEIDAMIAREGGDTTQLMSMERFENGRPLVWPIQRVKQVNRIVVHHTADSLDKYADDMAMIRAIYAYHAVSRGWGDIGYNYIVGQRGAIYEGRAGGDYVVGAHALYNNMGTVGIAVLGDYEKLHLNADQKQGLETILLMVAKKYGITLTDTKDGWKKCTKNSCTLLEKIQTPSLVGHGDVGVTSCPGTHIRDVLPSMRTALNREYAPVLNTTLGRIDPLPENEVMNLTLASTPVITPKTTSPALTRPEGKAPIIPDRKAYQQEEIFPKQYFGKKFRVRLSYPSYKKEITLSSLDKTRALVFLDHKRRAVFSSLHVVPEGNDMLKVTIGPISYTVKNFSFSAPVVSIDSWTRIPDWDKQARYNDTLFRDTIEVYNEGGSLVVINHLPLEWYLKGLGEVSNGDLTEKIKTITVAARTYALYYMQREHRKYNTHRYDGSDDPDSFQKYIGYSYERRSPEVAKVVDETRGEVIRYRGALIKPWYFSSSDGRTLSAREYCEARGGTSCEDIPYLQSVNDPGGVGRTRSGHGVGISGIGSTHFAREGWDYKKIIQYYLSGVEIGQ